MYTYLNDYVHSKSKYTVYALVPVYQKSKSFLKTIVNLDININ